MKSVKQSIVVRKDLNLKKGQLSGLVSNASMKFILENNESERPDELKVRLSHNEAQWLKNSLRCEVFGTESQDSLSDIAFRAEIQGLSVYSVFEEKADKDADQVLLCIAIGPDEEDLIDQLTNGLKPL